MVVAALLACCSQIGAGDLAVVEPAAIQPVARQSLIEASCNYFGELGIGGPFIDPPTIKLYRDGRMVFERDGGYFAGRIPEADLRALKRWLAGTDLLQRSTYLTDAKGSGLLHHGGFCHLRYLDGEDSRWIVASVDPAMRSWRRLVARLETLRPADARRYEPASLQISVLRQGGSPHREWPHGDAVDLKAAAGSKVEVTDPDVIGTLVTLPHRSFSYAGGAYLVRVLGAPGWYDAQETARRLAQLAQPG